MREDNSAPTWRHIRNHLKPGSDFLDRDPLHNRIHRGVTHDPVLINNENRWLCNSTLLAWIVDVPKLNNAPFCIAQNRKRQKEVGTHGLRLCRRIYRDRCYIRGQGPDLRIVIPVIRQLTEAERSPTAAIKQQRQRALRDQFR